MPLGHTERNPPVEFIFAGILRSRVHDADQLVAVPLFFVKQRCGMCGIEMCCSLESVPIIGEVVLLLRNIGHEDSVAVRQCNFVVRIFIGGGACSFDDRGSALGIAGLGIAHRCHLHMCTHVHVMVFHGLHGAGAAFAHA